MMLIRCAAISLAFAAPVWAGTDYPPAPVDLSGIQSQVTAANNTANSALSTASTTSAATQPCATPFPQNSLNGSVGAATTCAPRSDATVPTNVQRINTTIDGSCNWSVTFARTFVSSIPIVKPTILLPGASQPMPCIVTARSASAASGKCFPSQNTILNLSIITAGLTLAPFGTTCTAGTAVMIIAGEPTQ